MAQSITREPAVGSAGFSCFFEKILDALGCNPSASLFSQELLNHFLNLGLLFQGPTLMFIVTMANLLLVTLPVATVRVEH